MNLQEKWNENRPRIPAGRYSLKCIKGGKGSIWHEGKGGWGRTEKIILWFKVFEGEYMGTLIPMFLPMGTNGKIPQGSKYFISWYIANGNRRPQRNRLKEMPPAKFEGKVFEGMVVDVMPKWTTGEHLPVGLYYSRVDALYELIIGNPNN